MKLWKSSILIIGISVLALSSMTATAETESDPTGDVYHVLGTSYTHADKSNIDITEITYNDDGATFTLTMTVDGTIENSDFSIYNAEYVAGSISYHFVHMEGQTTGIGTNGIDGDFSPIVSISGGTITVVFTSYGVGDPTDAVFEGAAYILISLETGESYWDYAPETFAPWYGSGDGDGDGDGTTTPPSGTPGFELMAFIGAIAVALIILRKRK